MSKSNLKECEEILRERINTIQALSDRRNELQTTLAKEAVLKEDVKHLECQQKKVIEEIKHILPQLDIQEVIQLVDEKEHQASLVMSILCVGAWN